MGPESPASYPRRYFLELLSILAGIVGFTQVSESKSVEVTTSETAQIISLENSEVKIQINKESGGIHQISSQTSGTKLRVSDDSLVEAMWSLELYNAEYDRVTSKSYKAGSPSISTSNSNGSGSIKITWDNPPVEDSSGDYSAKFDATVSIRVSLKESDPSVRFEGSTDNRDDVAIKTFAFPYITGIGPLAKDDSEALILPQQMGRRVRNPLDLEGDFNIRYPSSFGSMQFTAYTSSSSGFYFDTRDTNGHSKELRWRRGFTSKPRIQYEHIHEVAKRDGADVSVPYKATVSPIEGDWFDAADRYRDWLDQHGWLPDEPNSDPPWYRELGGGIQEISYFRPEYTTQDSIPFDRTREYVQNMREKLGVPMLFNWWGWQEHGLWGGGDWFPPKEGMAAFSEVIDNLAENQVTTMAFINSTLLFESSDVWQDNESAARTWIQRTQDNELKSFSFGDFTSYVPELTAKGWQDRYGNAMETFIEHGGRIAHIDGFPVESGFECYSENHNHPVGLTGPWYPNQLKSYLQSLRRTLKSIDSEVLLSGEGACDYYLPEIDLQLTDNIRSEAEGDYLLKNFDTQIIPLNQYALGDHLSTWSNNSIPLVDAEWNTPIDYLRVTLARALVWGTLPIIRTAADVPEEKTSEALLDFAREIFLAQHLHAQEFLKQGQLVRSQLFDVPETEVSTKALEGRYTGETVISPESAVMTSGWVAEDKAALFATPITEETQRLEIDLSSHPFSSADSNRLFYSVRNGAYKLLPESSISEGVHDIDIESEEVVIIISLPKSELAIEVIEAIRRAQAKSIEFSELRGPIQAFTSGEYMAALDAIEQRLQSPTTIPESTTTSQAKTTSSTSASTVMETTSDSDSSAPTSQAASATTPGQSGFGVISAFAGLAGALIYRLYRGQSDEE